jgi:hypothetical protein
MLIALSCRDTAPYEPPVDTPKVKLILVDVAVREAYLGVQLAAPERPEICVLLRNGVQIGSFIATVAQDTIFASFPPFYPTSGVPGGKTIGDAPAS